MQHSYFEFARDKAPAEINQHPANIHLTASGKLIGVALSVLETQGYFQRGGLEFDATPRPLLTLPFLDFLRCLDPSAATIAELGAGQSTLFFQAAFKTVVSFETDANWLEQLRPRVASNVSLTAVTTAQLEELDFDLPETEWLLVDFAGKRTRFLHNLVSRRAPEALPQFIVLDNAEWYRRGAAILAAHGYQEIPFVGLKSFQSFVSVTSLFIKSGSFNVSVRTPMDVPYARMIDNTWDSET
ncbi:hypothetical protein [Caulobacter sp. 3R27C2-B]|uniref:hypothetical protein n=1 Tax=Caulobacter sp. 3R27C2-B TaxID=2502219 RepID=UPI0010FA413E|nr:hypothetical protein [Caulobacter sp. 3R27C2-B]